MAHVDTILTWPGRSGGQETDQTGMRQDTAVEVYSVLFDGAAGITDALGAAGVPAHGAAWSENAALIVCRTRALQVSPLLFDVTVEYAGKTSPLLQPVQRSWRNAKTNEPIDRDQAGDAILNPVGEPYTGIRRDYTDAVLVYTRNEATFPIATALIYQDAVNSDVFLGAAANYAKMLNITGPEVIDGGSYYRVTYEIQFRADSWRHRELCRGKRYWDGTMKAGKKRAINVIDDNGDPVSEAVRLKADGTLLPPGDPDVWELIDKYPKLPFAPLAITL